MAGLFLAQKIAGPADIHVVAGEAETRTQAVQSSDYMEALLLRGRQWLARIVGEIGVGTLLGTPDPAAELIELGQSEHIRTMHDQRIGGRHVQATLDDARAQQNVKLAVIEGGHHVFDLARRHAAVGGPSL